MSGRNDAVSDSPRYLGENHNAEWAADYSQFCDCVNRTVEDETTRNALLELAMALEANTVRLEAVGKSYYISHHDTLGRAIEHLEGK